MDETNRLPTDNPSYSETELKDQWSKEEKRLQYLEQLKREGKLPTLLELELQVLMRRDPMFLEGPGGPLPQKKLPWLK
jgi:hypothetical protein